MNQYRTGNDGDQHGGDNDNSKQPGRPLENLNQGGHPQRGRNAELNNDKHQAAAIGDPPQGLLVLAFSASIHHVGSIISKRPTTPKIQSIGADRTLRQERNLCFTILRVRNKGAGGAED